MGKCLHVCHIFIICGRMLLMSRGIYFAISPTDENSFSSTHWICYFSSIDELLVGETALAIQRVVYDFDIRNESRLEGSNW